MTAFIVIVVVAFGAARGRAGRSGAGARRPVSATNVKCTLDECSDLRGLHFYKDGTLQDT